MKTSSVHLVIVRLCSGMNAIRVLLYLLYGFALGMAMALVDININSTSTVQSLSELAFIFVAVPLMTCFLTRRVRSIWYPVFLLAVATVTATSACRALTEHK